MPHPRPAAERFESRINRNGPVSLIRGVRGQCHLWLGALNEHGYGRFRDDTGRKVMAHRWAYEHANEPVPAALVCDHLCRVRSCANPEHIEPVTSQINTLRGETIAATNAAKTACVNGHTFTAETTIIRTDGYRQCRICSRENARVRNAERSASDAEYRERKRTAARERMRAIRAERRAATTTTKAA